MKKMMWAALAAGMVLSGQEVVSDVIVGRGPATASGAQPAMRLFTRMSGDTVKGAPYAADTITETTQSLVDGNRIVRTNKSSFARDSQGRTRHETQIQQLGPVGQTEQPLVSVFIEDPVAKMQYHLDTNTKIVTRSPLTPIGPGGAMGNVHVIASIGPEFNIRVPEPNPRPGMASAGAIHQEVRHELHVVTGAVPGRKVKTEDLGEKTFEGVAARGQRTTLVIPAGEAGNEMPLEIVTEHWHSAALKAPVYTRHFDPRFGETITRLSNVHVGEPSAHLFAVPADFREAAAVEFMPARRMVVREDR